MSESLWIRSILSISVSSTRVSSSVPHQYHYSFWSEDRHERRRQRLTIKKLLDAFRPVPASSHLVPPRLRWLVCAQFVCKNKNNFIYLFNHKLSRNRLLRFPRLPHSDCGREANRLLVTPLFAAFQSQEFRHHKADSFLACASRRDDPCAPSFQVLCVVLLRLSSYKSMK